MHEQTPLKSSWRLRNLKEPSRLKQGAEGGSGERGWTSCWGPMKQDPMGCVWRNLDFMWWEVTKGLKSIPLELVWAYITITSFWFGACSYLTEVHLNPVDIIANIRLTTRSEPYMCEETGIQLGTCPPPERKTSLAQWPPCEPWIVERGAAVKDRDQKRLLFQIWAEPPSWVSKVCVPHHVWPVFRAPTVHFLVYKLKKTKKQKPVWLFIAIIYWISSTLGSHSLKTIVFNKSLRESNNTNYIPWANRHFSVSEMLT